ncbi:MAG TPA: mannitol dehydrogenase family protein [Propionibacteriaceae bacterium]|nr:mannitol dehydrogenase family protein [Propionibacteriaceae bacterium]
MPELTMSASPEVDRPHYERSRLTAGIVHVGVGGFHRAHQALAVDRLLNQGLATDFAICGVGLMPGDRRMQQVLSSQDHLYTLVEKAADGTRTARLVGSIIEFLYAPDDVEAVVEKMASPDTKIVSLTVTEGGYNISPVTGEFDLRYPPVAADLTPGATPQTTFGLVTEALRRRRARGKGAFTIMSCDNIQSNGQVAQRAFTTFARAQDRELAEWIGAQSRFPNSMVDRITPVTTDADRAEITAQFGVEDGWPVVAEPFFQWVLEDSFAAGRPPFEEAGVQVVSDVEPYELMKLRLLNAGHQALAYFGHLSGYRYAHEAAQDPAFAQYLLRYWHTEAIPTLHPVPGIDLGDYTKTLIERFSNAEVKDTIARLCQESSDRIPKWLVPVIQHNLATGGPVRIAAAIVASWARYAEGTDEQGESITVVDRLADELMAVAATQRRDRTAFLRRRDLFGDLADRPRFVQAYEEALESLYTRGAHATVAALGQ